MVDVNLDHCMHVTAQSERTEAEEIATDTVASTLEILSYVPSSMLTHDRMGEVLYMLAKVLRHPEILV